MTQDIFAAISAGDKDAVERIVAADPTRVHDKNANGVSSLMQARYESRLEIVAVLRKAAQELDIFEAAAVGDSKLLRELLAADPALADAFSADGFGALHLACYFNSPEAAKELLAAGADVNAPARNATRVAPLHSAAAAHNLETVKLLLSAGADPNARQQAGYVALHSAAMNGDLEMTRALLAAGANRELRSDDGKSAEEFARGKGHTAIVELLMAGKQAAGTA